MGLGLIDSRFDLVRIAGQGGMATVYQANDLETGNVVALKLVAGASADARFEREATLLARLEHPGIVRYVAHGRTVVAAAVGAAGVEGVDEGGGAYLAMEWIQGQPLERRLASGQALPVIDALTLTARVARALAAAHAVGIVHRDVKPSNVILRNGTTDDPVLLDFGIARPAVATQVMTAPGSTIGTPSYMAPEQARGDRQLDARADIFSLGCVLFECLTGHRAFSAEHVVAVLAKILLEQAPRIGSFRRDVPHAVDTLLTSMLAKSRDERPPTSAWVADVLENIGAGELSSEKPPSPSSIGPTEQRFATVLLARPHRPVTFTEGSLADTVAASSKSVLNAATGVRVHRLADGGLVGVLSPGHAGIEAAVRVVRRSLVLAAELRDVGIAVATGRAVVAGDVPVGAAIDTAARLLTERARPGQVWVCAETAALVETRFELSERSEDGGLVLHEHKGREPGLHKEGGTVPCVGRDRELALLEAMFRESAEEPIARSILIVGAPGMGKSRLQRELILRVCADYASAGTWLGLAEPQMEGAPFALVGDLVRRIFVVADGEPLQSRRQRILARVADAGVSAPEHVARRLGEISGTPFDDANDDALRAARRDPPLLAAQVHEAFKTFVTAELTRRPILVVAEDVHWADVASIRLLGEVLTAAERLPLMLVALARPSIDDVHPHLWAAQRCQRMLLDPLLRRAAGQLARSVLGEHADSEALARVEAIVRRAGGNALFVEELARACAEGRTSEVLPATIAAVVEARLASLPAEVRRSLRAAAVFGERFWAGGIAHLINAQNPAQVDESLRALEQREIVTQETKSRFRAEREYVFRHAVVRDAAYAMLTDADRTVGHALAAAWLESKHADVDGALLAHHYEKGACPTDAGRWYVRAAEQALAAHDFDGVFRSRGRAEALGTPPRVLGPARLAEAEAALWLGSNEAASTASRIAVDTLERASEKWFLAVGVGVAATGKLGDTPHLLALVDALESTRATDERSGRARAIARARAAIQLAYAGEIARADALLDRCEEEPGAAADKGVLAWIHEAACERGHAAGEPVHPSTVRRGRELCFEIGDRRAAFGQWAAEIQLLVSIGAFAEAVAAADALMREVRSASPAILGYVTLARAMASAADGDLEPVAGFARTLAASDNPRSAIVGFATAAHAFFAHGRSKEAAAYAEQAVSASAGAGAGAFQVVAMGVLVRVDVENGAIPSALERSERALQLSLRGLPVSGLSLVHLGRFEALEAAGRQAEATLALQFGVMSLVRGSKHLGEYREVFYGSWENPALLRAAKERGIEPMVGL